MEPRLPPVPPAFRGVLRTDLTARALYAQGAGIARTLPAAEVAMFSCSCAPANTSGCVSSSPPTAPAYADTKPSVRSV